MGNFAQNVYENTKTKVCIICPKHGEFWQTPNSHLSGKGCPKCASNFKLTTDCFISKAKLVHNNEYNYSKVKYIEINTKVCIICPKHGEFWQTPASHIRGAKCPSCFRNSLLLDTNIFIQKAIKKHGNKYDYSKVNYIDYHTKVCII